MTHFSALNKQGPRLLTLSLIPLLFNLTSCALLINGTGQMVPVSTQPVGVEVYLDDELMGVTPLELNVSRGQSHDLLLKYGEQERLIRLEPQVVNDGWPGISLDAIPVGLGAALSIPSMASYPDFSKDIGLLIMLPSVAVSGLLIGVDIVTGAIYTLNPAEVTESF